MQLRAVVLLVPMCMALYQPSNVHKNYAIASSCLGMIAMVSGNIIGLPFDALFLGLGVSLIIMMLEYFLRKARIFPDGFSIYSSHFFNKIFQRLSISFCNSAIIYSLPFLNKCLNLPCGLKKSSIGSLFLGL